MRGRSLAGRVSSVQWLRGLAVLLVVFVHAVAVPLGAIDGDAPAFAALPNLRAFGNAGVDLFFVISGFAMAHSMATPRTARGFLIGRVLRIWPLHLLGVLMVVLLVGAEPDGHAIVTTLTLLPLLCGTEYHLPVGAVGWTLGFEVVFYGVVALAMARGWSALRLCLPLGALAATGLVVPLPWMPARMLFNPLMGEFALGVAVWLAWRRGLAPAAAPLAFAAGLLLLAAGLLGLLPVMIETEPAMAVSGASGGARLLVWGLPFALVMLGTLDLKLPSGADRVLAAFGDSSYATYVSHLTVVILLQRWLVPTADQVPAFVATAIPAAFAVGLLVHREVEQPLSAWLREWQGRVGSSRTLGRLPAAAR